MPISETVDGHARNQRPTRAAQEGEDDRNDQDDGDDQGPLDVVDRGANGGGEVNDDVEIVTGGNGGAHRRQSCLDAIDGGDDVGAGKAEDEQNNGGLAD